MFYLIKFTHKFTIRLFNRLLQLSYKHEDLVQNNISYSNMNYSTSSIFKILNKFDNSQNNTSNIYYVVYYFNSLNVTSFNHSKQNTIIMLNNIIKQIILIQQKNVYNTDNNLLELISVEHLQYNKMYSLIYNWACAQLLHNQDFMQYEANTFLYKDRSRALSYNDQLIVRTFESTGDIVGIINYTQDSFSDGGLYATPEALQQRIMHFINHNVFIIDIGCQSTRPEALQIGVEQELILLQQLLPELHNIKLQYPEIVFSIDTYHNEIIQFLIRYNQEHNLKIIDIINDVSGNITIDLLKELSVNNMRYILMHNLGVPANCNIIMPLNTNIIDDIITWFNDKISYYLDNNINLNTIILDPGIGFGKNAIQSWCIIHDFIYEKHLYNFLLKNNLFIEYMLAYSRKSFLLHYMPAIDGKNPISRDLETAKLTDILINKVDYVRLHEVTSFNRLLNIQAAL